MSSSGTLVGSAPAPVNGTRGRRRLAIAAVGCVVAGSTALLAVGQVWIRYSVAQQPLPPRAASATGHVVAQPAATLALVVLAGVVVLPATRGIGRRVAGLAIALSGLGVSYLGILAIVLTTDQIPSPDSIVPLNEHTTAWPWATFGAGLLALGVGVFAVVASRGWPSMGRRYESGGVPKRAATSEASMWDRLDQGDDPTA